MLIPYRSKMPVIDKTAYIAPNATLIGDVTVGKDASIWFSAVLRGDECSIIIGEGSNVQDNATLHGYAPKDCNVVLGKYVTVGHNACVHGCKIGDGTLVGMGATILNGAVIGERCIIAAGALVKEGAVIPDDSLVVGVPGKVIRTLDPAQSADNLRVAKEYVGLGREYGEIRN